MKVIKNKFLLFLVLMTIVSFTLIKTFSQAASVKVNAWNNNTQQIPGRIQCELYDNGGEGIAYHDFDSVNNGSGKLNPANGTFLNEFRMKEGVDISYTKSEEYDNNPFCLVTPEMGQLYVGWTKPGEWIKYTVNVNITGAYSIACMYTSNGGGTISFDLDGKVLTDSLSIISTRNEKEPLDWRQPHHWNKLENLAVAKLEKGIHVLKLKVLENGKMNLDYIEFKSKN